MLALSCRLQLNFIFRLIIRHNLALKLGTCGRKGRNGDDHGRCDLIFYSPNLITRTLNLFIIYIFFKKKIKPNLDLSLEFFSFGRFPFFSLLLFSLFLKIRIITKKKKLIDSQGCEWMNRIRIDLQIDPIWFDLVSSYF